jgi:hypothetical protein
MLRAPARSPAGWGPRSGRRAVARRRSGRTTPIFRAPATRHDCRWTWCRNAAPPAVSASGVGERRLRSEVRMGLPREVRLPPDLRRPRVTAGQVPVRAAQRPLRGARQGSRAHGVLEPQLLACYAKPVGDQCPQDRSSGDHVGTTVQLRLLVQQMCSPTSSTVCRTPTCPQRGRCSSRSATASKRIEDSVVS